MALKRRDAFFPYPLRHSPDAVVRGVDFEWYANVGRHDRWFAMPKREGHICRPASGMNGRRHVWVEGHW